MNVALTFPGCHRRGGVERVMVECLNFLAGRGHEVHAFASDWDRSVLRSEVVCHDVRARRFPPALRADRYRRASQRLMRERVGAGGARHEVVAGFGVEAPPDSVVWMQSVHAAWMEVSRRSRPFRDPLRQRLNPFHPATLRAERRLLQGRGYRRIIALTPQVRDDLTRFYAVPPADVELLPNGFSGTEFNVTNCRANREGMRRRLGLPDDACVVVFVANETGRKGLPQLLRAVARLREPTVHVLAVGRFPTAPAAALAESLQLSGRVHFPGASDRVANFYAAADVFALPTQYEAWGLVIVEALASGLPVLTSRLAGAAVAVREGETGELLDDPRDEAEIAAKLARLVAGPRPNDADLAASVAHLEWSQVLVRYEEILSRCAS